MLKDFKNLNNYGFFNIKDWSNLIEKMFYNIQFEHNTDFKSCIDANKKYYLSRNPFGDGEVMSCVIHANSGNMRIYNSSLPIVVRQGVKVRDCSMTITEFARLFSSLDFAISNSFTDYIDFILCSYNIHVSVFNEYKKELLNERLNEMNIYNKTAKSKGYFEFRKFLFKHFITDNDVLQIQDRKIEDKERFKVVKQVEVDEKIKPQIVQASNFGKMVVERYLKKRKLSLSDKIEAVEVLWKGGAYTNYGVLIKYDNGFKKIRLIDNDKMRYFADGVYEDFFYARKNNSEILYIVEGELEAISILDFISHDIFAFHNVNSVPKNISVLNNYKQIEIRLDYDSKEKYEEVSSMVLNKIKNSIDDNVIINIQPKFLIEDGKCDYNYYLSKGELSTDKIK